MRKILWISPHLPYEKVSHAGGKIQNFYINSLIDIEEFDVRLIAFYWSNELDKFQLREKIPCDLICYHSSGIKKLMRNLLDVSYLKNPFNKYGNATVLYLKNRIISTLKSYRKNGYEPDVIILHWTQIVLFAKEIKGIFSKAKTIAIEEDVSFLWYMRKLDMAKPGIGHHIAEIRYKNILKAEMSALGLCDLTIVNNSKDEKLLRDFGFHGEIKKWSVFFHDMRCIERSKKINNDVVFYGAMNRPENYDTALWIIDYIKPLVVDKNVRFVMLGGNPPDILKKRASKDVVVTGFVDDITPYFKNSMCMIAPLVLGAGIKVKILEAFSAGIPVLTNEIGIEGIPAVNGVDYYHCEKPEEYAKIINELYCDKTKCETMMENAKKVISENFDYHKNATEFVRWIDKLIMGE